MSVEVGEDGFEIMVEREDGWCDWVHPVPGYRMKCCDCGLVHDMEFAIVKSHDNGPYNEGESDDAVIIFRARRSEEVL